MRTVDCGGYLELLSARLDGELTEAQKRELEAHLAACPECRAAGAQLAALQSAFHELEDVPAPEGFAQSVMDRVRESEPNKAVPLFHRPQFRVLAGLAACLALAAGLYCAGPRETNGMDTMTRDFVPDAQTEHADGGFAGEAPQIDARSVPGPEESDAAVYDSAVTLPDELKSCTDVLVIDRMPEGGWELISPDAYGSVYGLYVTGELLEQINQMAQEQGITASITSGTEESFLHLIVVLEETEQEKSGSPP